MSIAMRQKKSFDDLIGEATEIWLDANTLNEYTKAYSKVRYAFRRRDGKCVENGCNRATNGFVRCSVHALKFQQSVSNSPSILKEKAEARIRMNAREKERERKKLVAMIAKNAKKKVSDGH